jgi:hypothetical protein
MNTIILARHEKKKPVRRSGAFLRIPNYFDLLEEPSEQRRRILVNADILAWPGKRHSAGGGERRRSPQLQHYGIEISVFRFADRIEVKR